MNDFPDMPDDDGIFQDALAQLRTATPSAAMQAANRAAVKAALQPTVTPWWRQSIAVPVPVALATAAVLLIAMGIQYLPQETPVADPPQADVNAPSTPTEPSSAKTLVASTEPQWEYYETNRYVSGIGIIDRKFGYRIKE